jgi:hypothetical protein
LGGSLKPLTLLLRLGGLNVPGLFDDVPFLQVRQQHVLLHVAQRVKLLAARPALVF